MQYGHRILLHPLAFIVLAVVTVSTPLRAQVVGDRVRLFTADTTIIGQITGLRDEGFELASDELRRSFAYRDLDRLEVSHGMRSHWARGAALGGVGGAVVGFTRLREDDRAGLCLLLMIVPPLLVFCGEAIVESFGPPILIGGVAGAAAGLLFKHESWEPVSVEDLVVSDEEPVFSDEVLSLRGDSSGGDRVRVSVDGIRLIGRVTVVSQDGLELVQGDLRRSFAYRDIDRLERSIGMRSRWKAGLGLGLLGGFIAHPTVKGAWGCLQNEWRGQSCQEKKKGGLTWIGMGGLLGLGVGALMKREAWERIGPWDDTAGISPIVAPHRGLDGRHALLLGARIEF